MARVSICDNETKWTMYQLLIGLSLALNKERESGTGLTVLGLGRGNAMLMIFYCEGETELRTCETTDRGSVVSLLGSSKVIDNRDGDRER